MAITWDLTEVEDFDNLDSSLPDAGIWAAHGVGIPHLTEKNADEFFIRVSFWERVLGAYRMNEKGEDVRFTREDVTRLLGLRTNATAHTKAQFIKKTYEAHERLNR